MNPRRDRVVLSTLLLGTLLLVSTGGHAAADIIEGVPRPDVKDPLASWKPAQQWFRDDAQHSPYGYVRLEGALILADELGDRLSQLGRATVVRECFRTEDAASHLAEWALCATDVRELDLAKAQAELVAAGVAPKVVEETMRTIGEDHARARKIVDRLDEEARTDKGLQQLRADVEAAKKEWTDYVATHRADVELFRKLKDAARSGKTNHPGFEGCDAATRPRFEKLVRSVAKKIPYEEETLGGFMSYLTGTPDGYITTYSWAACAFSLHPAGDAPLGQIAHYPGNMIRAGWRSIAMGKLSGDDYQPRFADRSYSLNRKRFDDEQDLPGLDPRAHIMTGTMGEVKKMQKQADETLLSFKMGKIDDVCLRWETRYGEKYCVQRGTVDNEVSAVALPTAYLGGVKPGVSILTVGRFPIVAWKGKKILAILGVALK